MLTVSLSDTPPHRGLHSVKLTDPTLFRQQALIGAAWQDATDGARCAVHNPANAELIGHAPRCTAADTERAIEAAHAAFISWRATPAKIRAQLLRRWFDLIMRTAMISPRSW